MRSTCAGSQTVGPFFRIGLEWLCAQPEPPAPDQVTVSGRVLDGAGDPVPDAMLELWYADPRGVYSAAPPTANSSSSACPAGFARIATDDRGCYTFSLPKPGAVEFGDGRMQAPHVVILVFARGLLRHLITRMYFPDEPANETDPLLQTVPEDRRSSLVARARAANRNRLEWNVVLQGDGETVFFAW